MNLTEFQQADISYRPHYLLVGHPVAHSWSPLMHNLALDYCGLEAEYHAVDLQPNELTSWASHMNRDQFLGANITIPYKQVIGDYMDRIDSTADKIGAINTITKQDYRLEGHNTDYDGFSVPLEEYAFAVEGQSAVVFGTGGAARAIVVALTDLAVEQIYLVSRNPNRIKSFEKFPRAEVIGYHNWTSYAEDAALIVNATPLGMHSKVEQSPVREGELQWLADRICYDIVYNPLQTKFLRQAKQAGATTIGGLEMLIQQAARSFRLWTGHQFPFELVRDRLHEELAS